MKTRLFITGAIAMLAFSMAMAAEVSPQEAALAARAWAASGDPMGVRLGSNVISSEQFTTNGASFHAVKLEGGIVFTSADTESDPIIGFTSATEFDPSPENPLMMILSRDAVVRARMAADAAKRASAQGGSSRTTSATSSSSRWASLISEGQALEAHPGQYKLSSHLSSISDVRVDPLTRTEWNQAKANGNYCYNYYTPECHASDGTLTRALCGCSATALSQVIRYWEYPKSSVSPKQCQCYVIDYSNGSSYGYYTNIWTLAGTYDWAYMTEKPAKTSGMTDRNYRAIGRLTHDCAVALYSEFSAGNTSAYPSDQAPALKNTFGFACAQYYWDSTWLSQNTLGNSETLHRRAIYAPLDAGAPVMFAIYRYYNGNIYGGHCVVGDGYGYENVCGEQTPFVHINLGWGGSWDFWYNLPDVDTGSYGSKTGNYNVFGGVIYNIFPTNTGEVVSGRILNASGNPVSGATVAIARKGTTDVLKTTTSSSHGVYAFIVPAGYQYDVEAQASDGSFGSLTTATVPASSSSAIGNSWGNDITLQSLASLPDLAADCYLTTSANSTTPSTSFDEEQDIYAQATIGNSGGSSASGPFYVLHELLNSSDNVIGRETVTYTGTLGQAATYTFDPQQFSFMQNLAVGSYTYRVTVDSDDSVREWHEDNNRATFSFYVTHAVTPGPLEIVGASSIAAGEMATYTCMVNFSDGTRRSVTPIWTIDSGASYASVDSSGTVTAGLNDASHTVLLRATYALHGVSTTATKAITILPVIPLPIALDNTDLSFNTDSGSSQWYGQAGVSHDGVDAGRSGPISHGGTARMSTSVSGPGTLSFWYYVSSEAGYDRLEFYVDNVNALLPSASGETNSWTHYDVRVNDAGTHTFEWRYVKDGSESEGLDAAFIDQVVWQQAPTPESLTIDGASSLTAGTTAQYTCTVRMSDGTSKIVTPTWSMVAGGQYADISSSGLLSAHESDLDRAVTIGASYTESGITRHATKDVSIIGTLPPPEAPVIITYGAGDSDAAHIAWTEGRYAATYNVYCSADDNFQNAKLIFEGLDAMTRTASNASDPGVGLWYWVSAVNARGEAFSEGREAWRVARIEATPSAISAEAAGASANVSVSANTDWSVEVESGSDGNDYDPDTSNWIALGSRSGTGYGSFGVTVSANPVERERVGVVVVTAAPDTRHPEYALVRVTQSAYVKPGEPDYAFTLVEGGDAEKVLYTTATSEGPLARIVEAGDAFYARFGWINVGDGPGNGPLTHNFSFMNIDMLNVVSEDMLVNGTFEVDQGMPASHPVAGMDPGPYLMTGVLNAEGFLKEANPSDNVAEYRFAVRDPLTLGVALCGEQWTAESGITFATSDDEWFGSAGVGPEGVSGAMTKHGDHGYTNTLVATVSGPGTLSFDYRVSSENHDKFSFAFDGKTEVNAGGLLDWRTKTIEVKGDGAHEFVWKYSRDAKLVSGLDCALIANVVWIPDTFDAPDSVMASDGTSDSSVYVSWSVCPGARRYAVVRAESSDSTEWVEIGQTTSTNLMDTTALGGVTYWYRVKTLYANGTSDLSEATDDGWRKAKMLMLNTRTVPGESGDDTVTVDANCAWHATADADWITFAVDEGVGRAKLVYHFSDNDTGAQRTATITVTGAPGAAHPGVLNEGTRRFTVKQYTKVDYGSIVSLAAAAGTGATPSRLKFVTSGDAEWVGQTRLSHDGTSAMRSGPVADNGKSRVEVTLDRPGTLTFWWGTCCESNDKLKLYVDNVQVVSNKVPVQIGGYGGKASGPWTINNWEQRVLVITNLTGATVAWEYEKNGSLTRAEDAGFVDQVVWSPASITGHPFGEPVVRDGTPTFFDDMSVTLFDTPAACGDCLAVFDRATDELLTVQRVESEGYIPAFDINGLKANDKLYFKVWNAGSGLDHPEIFESAEPSDLVISDPDDPIVGFNVNITGTKPTYTVSYDLAGKATRTGGGELTQSVAFGDDAVDPEISVNPGWRFVDWDRSERTSVRCNMSITALYEEIIVPPETYTVTYDPGANGTGSQQTDTKTENVALTLKGAIFTRDGYTQTGWATSDGGAKAYGLGASYTANAAVTLYPFWAEDLDPATIRIDTEASYEAELDGSFMLDLGELIRSATTPTVTVKGLPTGIKFDSKKVVIAGTATKPGISTVTVSVKNKAVKTPVTATFELVVPNLRCDVLPELDPAPDAYGIVMCGVAFDPELVNCSTSESGWTVKVTGLPTGLKYDAKTGTITGVPTKAGTFTVTFTATKKGEKNRVATITLTTEALPTWATGTFTGDVKYGDDYGSATMTVAANGKVSGKVALGGTNWAFSAASYSSMESPAAFVVDADAKTGKTTMRVMLSVVECDAPQSLINSSASGEFGDGTIELWRNMWKDKATAAAAKAEIAKWEGVYTIAVEDGGYFSLTVGKTGDVKASGKLSDGTSVSVTAPLMFHFGKDYFTVFCVSPSAYKGGFVFLPVGFGQERGELYPIGDPLVWSSRNPQATGEYGMGFMRSNLFAGAYYDKLKKLNAYYESLRLGTDALPELGFTYKLTHLNAAKRKVTDSSAETAPAVDTLWQDGLTATVDSKGAFVVAKATKPVQDKTTKEWSYNGVNDGALTLSFTQATGIFKGSYTFWFDYESAYDETTSKSTMAHSSKKVSFEGVLVQGVETLRGFYLWDATGEYTDPKTNKLKTYKYKESFSVYLEP